MARVIIEEFHLTMRVPAALPEHQGAAIRRTLDGRRFQDELRGAVRAVVRRHRSLGGVTVSVTR